MKNRNLFALLSAGLLMVQVGSAMAADGKGNGGVAIVCRDSTGKVTKAEILDLFEGRNQFGLLYSNGTVDADTLVELAQLKMIGNGDFLSQFRKALSDVRAGLVFLPRGVGLTPTDDAFPVITKKGCNFEQLANYKDEDSKIYVDEEIYKRLSNVDRAALLIHESVYKMARVNQGDSSSIRSRKLTSQVLASNSNQSVIDSLMDTIGRKPVPTPTNRLLDGIYATDARYCGQKLYVDGDRLTSVTVDNPALNLHCTELGKTQRFHWGNATKENGQSVQGYMVNCNDDPEHWCGLIEVLDDRTFIQTNVRGTETTFYRW